MKQPKPKKPKYDKSAELKPPPWITPFKPPFDQPKPEKSKKKRTVKEVQEEIKRRGMW